MTRHDFSNPIWDSPVILPIEKEKSIPLSGKDSRWRFLFEEPECVPSPFGEEQDYDFSRIDNALWQPVAVPGSLVMQGYDIKNNREYYYKTDITVPDALAGGRLFIRFEGVYSNARVWVDGKFIRSHIGGFTPWDCEITGCAGKKFTLTVGVADIEGSEKGIWNPEGKPVSDAAWASFYAHHNVCGILRGITLFSLPESHFTRIHLDTALSKDHREAILGAAIQIDCTGEPTVKIELLDGEETIAGDKFNVSRIYRGEIEPAKQRLDLQNNGLPKTNKKYKSELEYQRRRIDRRDYRFGGAAMAFRAEIKINSPKLWDAEHPNLYTLRLTLSKDGERIETIEREVGLREICYGGANGTDKNKVYINGKEIKLRGVCRHDVSADKGRCITDEEAFEELSAYKRNNINFVRTSHYPASEHFLALCDKLGIYVEQENSACFKGANDVEIQNPPEEFLDTFAEMVEYARNHPSVIIWSLANESGFENSIAFRREYEYIKSEDPSRPCIFSYPFTVKSKPAPYDIYSKHYARAVSKLGKKNMPILHDEFAHVACYNVKQLQNGVGCRTFWGESIMRGWDNIFHADGALGCAIWGAIDDVFCMPEGVPERHQHHSAGTYAGYGEWGCILDRYRREKPEAFLTKKAYSPVHIKSVSKSGGKITLAVENRFDHADICECRAVFKDKDGSEIGTSEIKGSIAPHKSGNVTIESAPENAAYAEIVFGGYAVETFEINKAEHSILTAAGVPEISVNGGDITLRDKDGHGFGVSFSCATLKKPELASKIISTDKSGATIKLSNGNIRFKAHIRAGKDGVIFRVSPNSLGAAALRDNSVQIKLTLPEKANKISWERDAQYERYPENHIGRPTGTAERTHGEIPAYGARPECAWEQDIIDRFLFQDDATEVGATRDFSCQRDRVKSFTAFAQNSAITVHALCGELRVQLNVSEKSDCLLISRGYCYPDLEWGNYTGKSKRFRNKNIAFKITAGKTGDEK